MHQSLQPSYSSDIVPSVTICLGRTGSWEKAGAFSRVVPWYGPNLQITNWTRRSPMLLSSRNSAVSLGAFSMARYRAFSTHARCPLVESHSLGDSYQHELYSTCTSCISRLGRLPADYLSSAYRRDDCHLVALFDNYFISAACIIARYINIFEVYCD